MPVSNYVVDPTIPPGPIRPRKDGALAVVDDFEIIRPLGAGGFGTVYLAKDTTSDIEVALKVIGKDRKSAFGSFGWKTLPKGTGDPAGLEDELRENFKLIHGLTHPHIAVAYPLHLVRSVKKLGDGVFIVAGDILSVMAYAPGVTLDKWRLMFDGGCVPPRDAADIIAQIADALACAHGQGIIHRDVKPSNVMVDTMEGGKPFVRLLDFGLATKIGGEAGEVCGTPQYMSPEQWTGRVQDAGADQYSLAVLACELLTGHVPFENVFKCGDAEVTRIAVATREAEIPAGLGAKVRSVLLRGLAKTSAGRYPSCLEFARELSHACAQKKWFVPAGACAALLAVGVVAALLIGFDENGTETSGVKEVLPSVSDLGKVKPIVAKVGRDKDVTNNPPVVKIVAPVCSTSSTMASTGPEPAKPVAVGKDKPVAPVASPVSVPKPVSSGALEKSKPWFVWPVGDPYVQRAVAFEKNLASLKSTIAEWRSKGEDSDLIAKAEGLHEEVVGFRNARDRCRELGDEGGYFGNFRSAIDSLEKFEQLSTDRINRLAQRMKKLEGYK